MTTDRVDELARSAALSAVDELRNEHLATLVELVQTPSVSGTDGENDAQASMARLLADGGLDVDHWQIDLPTITADPDFPGMEVERSEAWGVVGRLAGHRPDEHQSLMLNGHIDVVPTGDAGAWADPPFDGAVRGNRLHGRGACDMKAGLLASHWAVQAIRRAGIRLGGDVLVASVQGEEDGGLGTFATLRRGWSADVCLIAEPTDLDIIPANSGALTFRLRVPGQATHAATRLDGVSAIEKFIPIHEALLRLEAQRHEIVDPLCARWDRAHPLSIGSISSGDWASSVPDLLVAEGRLGVAIGEPVDEAKRQFERAIAAASEADPWLRDHPVEVEWWGGQFASGRLPADSDLADRVAAAHATVTSGGDVDTYGAPYGSDLRLLTGIGGIPTLQYGPGDVALAHGPLESVDLDDVAICARTLSLMILDICGTA